MADMSSNSVSIDAPAADVMAVLVDIESFPTWSSAIKEVEVLERDSNGHASQVKVKVETGALKDRATLSYDYSKLPSEISFSLDDADLMTEMNGAYQVKDNGDDTTTVTYSLGVAISMPIPDIMRRKAEQATIDAALGQLKKRVEG